MNLKFMQQSLKENHLKAGLYVEQTGDDTIALMRVGKAMPVKEFDSRASLQSVVDAADQYLGEITNVVSFKEECKMNGTDGAPKTKRINRETYRLAGTDLRQEQLDDLRQQGFSVRTFYNRLYRETYTYIK